MVSAYVCTCTCVHAYVCVCVCVHIYDCAMVHQENCLVNDQVCISL
jgi:hypothetical protein